MKKYDGKINFNFRHFPLMAIHQKALKAAEAAIAAAQEGKFLEMHEMLFDNQKASWNHQPEILCKRNRNYKQIIFK